MNKKLHTYDYKEVKGTLTGVKTTLVIKSEYIFYQLHFKSSKSYSLLPVCGNTIPTRGGVT